jgi:phosphatidylserine/phosphatidylglycerophosphate/cardiolipin synthase-like enzyme
VDANTKLPVQLSQLAADLPAVEMRDRRIEYLQTASSLRSAAYTLARKPAGAAPPALPSPVAAQKVLDANKDKLKVKGVTKAYVGWLFENNWITRERAIVVLARSENLDAVRNSLPDAIRDIPIEVRRDPRPRRASEEAPTGMLLAADSGAVREEFAMASFPGEVLFEVPDASAMLAAKAAKPKVKYQPPKDVSLAPITADMTLILHASPEQGWAQLRSFLNATRENLVIGMYEFTAPHIEKAVLDVLGSSEKLTLTLDSPPAKGSREQTVEETDQHLQAKLGQRLDFAWALAGLGHDAPAVAFPTSYHIKVAVRDGKSVWVSSGNFNSSNQPALDPDDEAALADAAKKNDRDWHVICDCEPLAQVFRKYLLQDFATAAKAAKAPKRTKRGVAALAAAAAASSLVPLDYEAVAARPAKSFFTAHTVTGNLKVKPLLTPDDYRKPILDLIKSAKRTFFMQTQYIHTIDAKSDGPPPFGGPKHMDLIAAVADLIRGGVDVRIITSEFQDHGWIEKLQDAGVDAVEHLRIQAHVHNKGIVVDSSIAVVSSQNWSPDGTGANRDAGLIIYNEEAAQYFESIFLHDWVNMAAAKVLR